MTKNFKIIIIIFIGLFIFFIFFKGLEKSNNYSPNKNLSKFEVNFKARLLYENKEILLEDLIKKK